MQYTAAITRDSDFLMGQIKELPGVITQGKTPEEVHDNLLDALQLYLEDAGESADAYSIKILPQ